MIDRLQYLIDYLNLEMGEMPFSSLSGFDLFRALVNVRKPEPIDEEFLREQDIFLGVMIRRRGIVNIDDLTPVRDNIYIFQGDITTLAADAIVNAANDRMLGCFHPLHKCIDNAIHTFAGVQLRLECHNIMREQGSLEQTGQAKCTGAYNLPSKHVIHTVGPIVYGDLTKMHEKLLEMCYRNCLQLAIELKMESIAFCCISTGEFHFPNARAAEIAVNTVQGVLSENNNEIKVVFNVFKDVDLNLYKTLLG